MKAYVATVQLLIVANNYSDACDAISNMLSEYEMADGTLKDWAYLSTTDDKGNMYLMYPTEVYEDYYKKGDFLGI